MKRIKLYEAFVEEKLKFSGTCNGPLCDIIPSLEKIGDLAFHQDTPQDLLKMQAETNKILKMINAEIKATIDSNPEDGIDWEKAPLAPIFVLNLAKKYPQHEKAYHDLWYKAAKRQPAFTYGGAIMIFKTYCNREDPKLMLEDHEYGLDESIVD